MDKKQEAVGRMRDGGTPIEKIAKEYGVCKATLYNWRRDIEGIPRSASPKNKDTSGLSSEEKFNVLIETSRMNEHEKAEYCRSKGIYIEQLKEWEEICKNANARQVTFSRELKEELRKEKENKAKIERELRRKEKALAEAAALLVLRKKAQAIWGDPEDE